MRIGTKATIQGSNYLSDRIFAWHLSDQVLLESFELLLCWVWKRANKTSFWPNSRCSDHGRSFSLREKRLKVQNYLQKHPEKSGGFQPTKTFLLGECSKNSSGSRGSRIPSPLRKCNEFHVQKAGPHLGPANLTWPSVISWRTQFRRTFFQLKCHNF